MEKRLLGGKGCFTEMRRGGNTSCSSRHDEKNEKRKRKAEKLGKRKEKKGAPRPTELLMRERGKKPSSDLGADDIFW